LAVGPTSALLRAENDPRPGQVVRRKVHRHLIARQNLDVVHPHLPGDVAKDYVSILQFHPERRVRQRLQDFSLHLYRFFFRHPFTSQSRSDSFHFLSPDCRRGGRDEGRQSSQLSSCRQRAALLEILGGLLRVVLQRRIEEAEKYDRRRVQYLVHRLARGKRRRQVAQPDRVLTRAKPLRQRRRKENDRRRENRRNHAGHVELERQKRLLAGIDLVADLALGVIHLNLAQRPLDIHHERRDGDHQRDDSQDQRDRIRARV